MERKALSLRIAPHPVCSELRGVAVTRRKVPRFAVVVELNIF
jgi:hypothetical protein